MLLKVKQNKTDRNKKILRNLSFLHFGVFPLAQFFLLFTVCQYIPAAFADGNKDGVKTADGQRQHNTGGDDDIVLASAKGKKTINVKLYNFHESKNLLKKKEEKRKLEPKEELHSIVITVFVAVIITVNKNGSLMIV